MRTEIMVKRYSKAFFNTIKANDLEKNLEDFESSQKLAGNAEGAKRPTAGDEGCEFTSHPEGGRVPPFIEKLQDFESFRKMAKELPALMDYLLHPLALEREKSSLLKKIFPKRESSLTVTFIGLLLKRHRFHLFDKICSELDLLVRAEKGIILGKVESAVPLTEKELQNLSESLSRRVNAKVELQTKVDPRIKGGLLVHVGDLILDSTIRTRMKTLSERLSSLTSDILRDLMNTPVELV